MEKPHTPTVLTVDEYRDYKEKASFKCPIRREARDCDRKGCPKRQGELYEDYSDECVDARHARNILDLVRDGLYEVHQNHNSGWEVPL